MKSIVRTVGFAALFAATTLDSHAFPALQITDGAPAPAFTYGTNPGDNNVVNVPASGLMDGAAPTTWQSSAGVGNVSVSVTGLAVGQSYIVQYTYLGSESGDVIKLTAPGVAAAGFSETNANNNCGAACGGSAQTGQANIGLGSFNTINFTLTDTRTGAAVTNGGPNPAPSIGGANLIFSYATFAGGKYTLTASQTGFVIFGFNDDGGTDDNHDDFVGAITLIPGSHDPAPTPVPATLPLFVTGLGALGLFGWRKKREARKRAAGRIGH